MDFYTNRQPKMSPGRISLTDQPPFRALVRARKRFVAPALVIGLGLYIAVAMLAGYAPGLMSQRVAGPINLGYLLIFITYLTTWTIAILYVRRANRTFDPLSREAARSAEAGRRSV